MGERKRIADYGSWPSPVTIDLMLETTVVLDGPQVDGGDLYWAEVRFDEGGTTSVWRQRAGESPERLTTRDQDVRSDVYEYGGGAWAVDAGVLAFCDRTTGRVLVHDSSGMRTITDPRDDVRYGDLSLSVDTGLIFAVRECRSTSHEPVHDLVCIGLNGHEAVTVLASGSDFYAAPHLCSDGRLAWVEWDHPNMPWQATRLMTGSVRGSQVSDAEQVAGGPTESALHPRWQRDRQGAWTLLFCSDRSGYWNLYRRESGPAPHRIVPLAPLSADFTRPMWGLGHQPFAPMPGGSILCSWFEEGRSVLGVLDPSGELEWLTTAASSVVRVSASSQRAAVLVGYPDRPPAVAAWSVDGPVPASAPGIDDCIVRAAGRAVLPEDSISVPQAVRWEGSAGLVYGWYYPPANSDFRGPEGSLPPLIVMGHGGPTSLSQPVFGLDRQMWTSRGFALLDVNYSGSAGFGRAYRERLDGRWGVLDVADCVDGARAMVEQGRADPQALVVRGASAGGYLVLRALTTSTIFSAGVSIYGISDLASLTRSTHKFESHYFGTLIGNAGPQAARLRDRSPIHDVDRVSCPVLLLQGLEDQVVPPTQSRAMATALAAHGVSVELVEFDGEGHGFRGRDALHRAFTTELAFLRSALTLPGDCD